MFQTVELPVWALVLICLLAAVTAASRFLFPSVRWFFRRRAERVVARLNTRLARPIQPFKLAQRHDMIQNVLYDPDVIEAVNDHAERHDMPDNVAFETAERYAREIVPSFSASVYFGFGTRAAHWLAQSLYRVKVYNPHKATIARIDPSATVVYVINHRSNMDYVLVTYLAAQDSALSYAVGEWARVWPLRPVIKMMGGYFIRRKSLNPLYRRVLARYVQLSVREGVTQAVFPEGGLSRDGTLGEPKLGLLSYILSANDRRKAAEVVFVPVGLNYDRVLEDRVLVASKTEQGARTKFRMRTVFRYVGRHIWQRVSGRFHRLGMAGVVFGAPVSLREVLDACAPGSDAAAELGATLMTRVSDAVPILPVPMVCAALLREGGDVVSIASVQPRLEAMVEMAHAVGYQVALPHTGITGAVEEALVMLSARGLIDLRDQDIGLFAEHKPLLQYYANSVQHIGAT